MADVAPDREDPMLTTATLAALLAPVGFLVAAAIALLRPGARPVAVVRSVTAAGLLGLVVSLGVAVAVAREGLLESPTLGVGGLGLSVRLDPLSAVMLGMIALLAVVIVRYSSTYLDGDPRHGRFLGRLAATVAAVEVLVLAGNLGLFALAWVATSLALHQLLVFHPERRRAVIAARKKFLAARLGDVLLLTAVGLLYARFGTGNLQELFVAVQDGPAAGWTLGATGAAAACLAVAAMLKSAQFPTHGWLVEVMETPTPVSALLHAGVLNAGPFLVIRFGLVMDGAAVANTLLLVVGAGTALFASVVLLTQPTVKVALGYSSAAHMGFMLLVCGLGVYPAALLHLVAHSFYKAHAFLASGSVIDEARAARVRLPQRLGSPWRVAGSLGVAVALYVVIGLAWGAELRDPILLAIGAMLMLGVAQIVAPALDSDGPVLGVLRASGLALGVVVAFFVLEAGAHVLLGGVVPEVTGRSAVHLTLAAAVLLLFAAVVTVQVVAPARPQRGWQRALAIHLRNGLYANALLDRLVGGLRPGPLTTRR